MRILFRTNAGREGLGHLNRIYSLYRALNEIINYDYKFIVNNEAKKRLLMWNINQKNIRLSDNYNNQDVELISSYNPDIVVVDTYKSNNQYFNYLKENCSAVVVMFDDNSNLYSDITVDVLINGNVYADNLNYEKNINYKQGLFGPPYLVMNPQFWPVDKSQSKDDDGILVTCGGADPKNLMIDFINKLDNINLTKKIVVGPYFTAKQIDKIKNKISNKDKFKLIMQPVGLKKHIEKSALILTAAGSTVYETLTLNKRPIIYIMEDDQVKIANSFAEKGVINLGWQKNIKENNIFKAIKKANGKTYKNKLQQLYNCFDGSGARRVAKKILEFRGDL
ncbi:UDP-2,4-diacetamido-2,4,6-trideoxy-beta-L-altropyranose hydrolase [Halanaerocella petrolearia]